MILVFKAENEIFQSANFVSFFRSFPGISVKLQEISRSFPDGTRRVGVRETWRILRDGNLEGRSVGNWEKRAGNWVDRWVGNWEKRDGN